MTYLILGFITGLSLILAIGAQNIFVIEQGLKKQYIFLVCFICSISDLILIFLGIFLFEYFKIYFTQNIELIFNILLLIFIIYFIYSKIRSLYNNSELRLENNKLSLKSIIIKTLGFTYLNPHVYSDTVFFFRKFFKEFFNFSKIFFWYRRFYCLFFIFFFFRIFSKIFFKLFS